jgi:hypothetical protein
MLTGIAMGSSSSTYRILILIRELRFEIVIVLYIMLKIRRDMVAQKGQLIVQMPVGHAPGRPNKY